MGMTTISESAVKEFLAQCKVSGDSAYNVIKGVLERLHNEDTRVDARKLLAAVENRVQKEEPGVDTMAVYHFRLHQLSLTDYEGMVNGFRYLYDLRFFMYNEFDQMAFLCVCSILCVSSRVNAGCITLMHITEFFFLVSTQ